ncbi:MAG: iron ABC transporter permease [Deltaproteobacteria bacterium]|jgi:iron complex transport system permease protein|nr:iron ABC transporter permease [Deltaproteobacteria bacterium]
MENASKSATVAETRATTLRALERERETNSPRRVNPWIMAAALTAAIVVIMFLSLSMGYLSIPFADIWNVLARKIFWGAPSVSESLVTVIWDVRFPRLLTSLASGAALGLSGAIFQGILLNPLADPYTLGVSSGAAFGASIILVLAIAFPALGFLSSPLMPAAGAFVASVLTLVAVMALAADREGRLPPPNLILAGVIMSAILSAAISFIKYLAGDQVSSIIFWLLGSFQARTWTEAALVFFFFVPALVMAIPAAMDLNIMTLGLRSAETLGVNTGRVRLRLLVAASIAASASVAVAGIIGFVGLIVPHLVRLLTGPDHRSLLPLSALGGACLLAAADTVVRVFLPGEIPVGVLTALLAGPAFLVIFRRKMKDLVHV